MKRKITVYNWIPSRKSKYEEKRAIESLIDEYNRYPIETGLLKTHRLLDTDNTILICHKYKIYFKDFECTPDELKYIIKKSQQRPDGVHMIITLK